jgi:sugar phosphate isomerase/epimerase
LCTLIKYSDFLKPGKVNDLLKYTLKQNAKGKITMGIKIGVCDQVLPGAGIFAPRIVYELGLDGMSIEMGTGLRGYPASQQKLQKYYLDEQQKYGIEYANISMSDLDNHAIRACPGSPEYSFVRMMMKTAVITASAMKIDTIMVCCFEKSFIKTVDEMERAAKMVQYMCDLAEEKGIRIGYESVLEEKKLRAFFNMVDRKNIEAFYDSQNYLYNAGLDQAKELEMFN